MRSGSLLLPALKYVPSVRLAGRVIVHHKVRGMAKLTTRSLKKIPLPTGSGAREVPDSGLKGLVFVLHHSGAGTWAYRYRNVEGQQRRLKIGRWPGMSPEQARTKAAAAFRRVSEGEDPQAVKAAAREAERTGQLEGGFVDEAKRFVESYAREHNKSWHTSAHRLGLKLVNREARKDRTVKCEWTIVPGSPCDLWRKRAVSSITKLEINEAVDVANERGPILANRVHAALTRFFGWATERGLIVASPALGTKAPNREQSRDRVLTPEELSHIWWAAEKLKPPFGAFVRLLILTAARRNEVSGMTRGELAGGAWTIPAGRSKNGKPNPLPLPVQAREIIAELPSSGLLFTTTGSTPISGFSKMKRVLDGLVAERTKVAPWTLHDVRRSAATGMASLGVEPHVIDLILGHVFGKVTKTYNLGQYADQKKAALEQWAAYLEVTASLSD